VYSVEPTTTVNFDAIKPMAEKWHWCFEVLDKWVALVGIVSERDYAS
jgi:CBS-domain-containing membrane protein